MAIAGAFALWHGPTPQLLRLGAICLLLSGIYTVSRAKAGLRSVAAQLSAIACISILAPLAWLLIAGPTEHWSLSAPAAFLAFGGTVPYVRERVRRRRFQELSLGQRIRGGYLALSWQAGALLAATVPAATELLHPLVPAAFVPGAAKTFLALLRPERRPPIRRIGVIETLISTVFAVLVGIGLGLSAAA
jgi:hypothetical protein